MNAKLINPKYMAKHDHMVANNAIFSLNFFYIKSKKYLILLCIIFVGNNKITSTLHILKIFLFVCTLYGIFVFVFVFVVVDFLFTP